MENETKKKGIDPMTVVTEEDKAKDEAEAKKLISMLRFGTPKLYEKMIKASNSLDLQSLKCMEEDLVIIEAIRKVIAGDKTVTSFNASDTEKKLRIIIGLVNHDIKSSDLEDIVK